MPVNPRWLVPITSLVLLCVAMGWFSSDVWAQAPHPFAAPEQALPISTGSWFSQWTGQIAIWQSDFYRQLTGAVRAWKADGFNAWWLLTLSFAYGVFHALGPGHGKAILSAYVLANRETIRNGAILAFVSALLQALVAIGLVAIAAGILNVTGAVMNQVTAWLELGAYALLSALGVWLVIKHVIRPLTLLARRALARAPDHEDHQGSHAHHHDHQGEHHNHGTNCGCGHSHLPSPDQIAGKLNWRKAWGAMVAIGLRPCSGAILVLVFALSQHFFLAGVAAALAMGVGTGLTVATLAMLSLTMGRLAETTGGGQSSPWGRLIGSSVQALASLAVLVFGLLLFSATWQYSL